MPQCCRRTVLDDTLSNEAQHPPIPTPGPQPLATMPPTLDRQPQPNPSNAVLLCQATPSATRHVSPTTHTSPPTPPMSLTTSSPGSKLAPTNPTLHPPPRPPLPLPLVCAVDKPFAQTKPAARSVRRTGTQSCIGLATRLRSNVSATSPSPTIPRLARRLRPPHAMSQV
jgi:hypothetical protein